MLDVNVGEDRDIQRIYLFAIAKRSRAFSFDQAFVADIGIDPLIDPYEARAARFGDRKRADRAVGKQIDAEGDVDGIGNPRRDRGHSGDDLRSYLVRLQEGDVAMIFKNDPIHSALDERVGIGERSIDDARHRLAAIARRARKRWQMDIAD